MPMPKPIQKLKDWWWKITGKKLHTWWWDLTEKKRQFIQQPLHVGMSFAVVALLHLGLGLPIVVSLVIAVVALGYREYLQFPSTREWDPPLDIAAQFIGLMIAQYWYQ